MTEPATILGPDGRPLPRRPITAEVATPQISGVRSVWTQPVAAGLSPERLARILRDAAEPGGDTRDYLTLAEEIEEREPHYRAVLTTRKLALRGLKPVVEAASEDGSDVAIADAVRALVETPAFRTCIVDLADGLAKGYSVVELMWETGAAAWAIGGFRWRDPRFFQFDRVAGTEIRLRQDGSVDGLPLPPAKFIVHVPKLKSGIPIRGGLARAAVWMFMLKSFSLKDWMAFLDVYGIPWRIGKWHAGASEEDKRALLRAVSHIAADGAAIVPESMVIEFLEAKAASNSDAFERICKYLDTLVSKLVLGQTTTTDAISGGHAVSKEHQEVRLELLAADADELAATVQRDMVVPFVHFNFGLPPNGLPQLTLPVLEPEDLKALMQVTGEFVDRGGRVSAAEVRDKLGWADPDEGEEVLRPIARGGPAGGEAEGAETASNHARRCPRCGGTHSLPSPASGGGSGRGLALHRAGALDVEAELDALIAVADDWEPMLRPIVGPLTALARDATSFEELLRRLPHGAFGAAGMSSAELVKRLERATAIARGLGDVEP